MYQASLDRKPELSVIMPCLNEERTVGACISKALSFFEKHQIRGEVIIGDNGSTDHSIKIAENLGARVAHVSSKGYGNAILGALEQAKGTYVIMGDSDDSYDFSNLMPFVSDLRSGSDLVMGNRFKGGIEKGAMPFLHKYLGNPVLSFIGRLFFKTKVRDFHCGLRGFNRERIEALSLECGGMEFASEMVVKSILNNYKVTEVPTTLSKDGRDRPPHLNTFRDGWRHLRFLLIYSPKWLFLYPGIFSFVLGAVMTVLLLKQPLRIWSVNLDVNSLAYFASMGFIGLQLVFFFVFSRYYAGLNGLLPQGKFHSFFRNAFSLERGLIAGFLTFLAGLGLTIYAFVSWKNTGYGDLSPRDSLRIVIPAVFLLLSGVQIIQSSFFLSLMELKKKQVNG